jgi:hypothetical protein
VAHLEDGGSCSAIELFSYSGGEWGRICFC